MEKPRSLPELLVLLDEKDSQLSHEAWELLAGPLEAYLLALADMEPLRQRVLEAAAAFASRLRDEEAGVRAQRERVERDLKELNE